ERRLVDPAAVLLDAGARPLLQALERPAAARDPDDRHVEVTATRHRVQRREDLLVGEVAGGAEEDERVRAWCLHVRGPSSILGHPERSGAIPAPARASR